MSQRDVGERNSIVLKTGISSNEDGNYFERGNNSTRTEMQMLNWGSGKQCQ